MEERLNIYRKQLQNIITEIERLSHEHGLPKTILLIAHFEAYALSHEIRVFTGKGDDE